MTNRRIPGEAFLVPGNTGVYDAFGRVRVSNPQHLYDTTFAYDVQPLSWGTILAGDGAITHVPAKSAVDLTVGTASGARVAFQTKRYHRYQPGKSLYIMMSFVLGARKANVRRRIGYFDNDNGIFLEQTQDGLFWVRRSKTSGVVVEERVHQSVWSIDRMMGLEDRAGASDITLDDTKVQLLVIDLQWLSAGRVRVGFDLGGEVIYCHEFVHANVIADPYMSTANLPVRYELDNTALTASGSSFLAICSAVVSEGGYEPIGFLRNTNNGTTANSVTAREPVLSIRPKLTFNSLANRGLVIPVGLDVLTTSDCMWELVYGGVLTGASWASVSANSNVEKDQSATAITGGEVWLSGYKGADKGVIQVPVELSKRALALNPAGTASDILSVVCTSLSGTSGVNAALNWREDW